MNSPANATAAPATSAAPKRKERDPYVDSRVAAAVQLLITVLNVLPAGVARWFGRSVGRLMWRVDKRHRNNVLRHMEIAFRDGKTRAEREELCRKFFEHLGLSAVEFARLEKLNRENVDELCDLSELKKFDELLARGKGLLCVPAHHGNWELCGYAVALKGYPIQSVARPLDNPHLDALITSIRERAGNTIIQKWKVLWKLKKLLDRGAIVTMSIDQNGGTGGVFVPCFGTLASTISSPAELHLVTGVPILIATMNRKPDGIHHVLRVWDVIEHAKTGDHESDVRAVTARINAAVEKAVREYPEQWLWLHKRWKTRPPGEAESSDGLPPRLAS
ncbi:MAG TPA: lysophospholipid acyltransferase family protein [Planctomycetota bacterium]|nr:lysophospholipid acyltransferase family protein [Planctomycetota bacterium]